LTGSAWNTSTSVPDDSADDVDRAMQELSEEHGFDAEVL
jgi:hypothetical protein